MNHESENDTAGIGEKRNRQRIKKQVLYIAFAGLIGGIIGFSTSFFDQGSGNLFAGDWDQLSLPPVIAIALAVGLVFAFVALPLWGFTYVDELKREYNYIAFTGGSLAVLAGFPIWAVLYAGGFAPPPHAFGVWLVGFAAMAVSYPIAQFKA